MVPQQMCTLVSINDGHLHIHQDDIWLRFDTLVNTREIFQGFLSIPGSRHLEAKSTDCFGRNLLVDGAITVSSRLLQSTHP
jgi:hypothetical protein